MSEFVRVQTEGAVGTIRLDRPPMNALNAQLQDELAAAAAQVSGDDAIRAVVIYGGEKVFAAGADIKEMAEASYATMAARSRRLQACLHRDRQDPQAGRGGGHRLRARRRPRTGAVRRLPGPRREGARSASRRSCSASSPARAGPSGCPA